jgi:hypothetical protein
VQRDVCSAIKFVSVVSKSVSNPMGNATLQITPVGFLVNKKVTERKIN